MGLFGPCLVSLIEPPNSWDMSMRREDKEDPLRGHCLYWHICQESLQLILPLALCSLSTRHQLPTAELCLCGRRPWSWTVRV